MASWCGPLSRLPQNIIPVRIIVSTYTRSVLLINLPDSKNRFVRAPIKCRRWRPPSHLYTPEFCRRFPVKERGFYTRSPLNYLLSHICWNSFLGPEASSSRPTAALGSLYRLLVVPRDLFPGTFASGVPGKRTNIFMFLTVYCVAGQDNDDRERQDRVLDFIQILW